MNQGHQHHTGSGSRRKRKFKHCNNRQDVLSNPIPSSTLRSEFDYVIPSLTEQKQYVKQLCHCLPGTRAELCGKDEAMKWDFTLNT
jgi:hypothetical protein